MGAAADGVIESGGSDELSDLDAVFQDDDPVIDAGLSVKLFDPVAQVIQVRPGSFQSFFVRMIPA